MSYIGSVNEACLPQVTKYLGYEQPYCRYLFAESYQTVSPTAWWSSGIHLGFDEELVNLAKALVSAIGSSGGLKRQFSTLGMTYGSLRNQLDVEKAGKMTFLYKQFNC